MKAVLRDFIGKICLLHMDDEITFSKTPEEYLVKPFMKKCSLFKNEVPYLGHIVSASGLRTDPGKNEAITECPISKDCVELKRFQALCICKRFCKYQFLSKIVDYDR